MSFSDIETRGYTRVSPSWWNVLKTAGMRLESILGVGDGAIAETSFTFAQGASAASITGLTFDVLQTKAFTAKIFVSRSTTTNEAVAMVSVNGFYRPLTATWDIGVPIVDGDDVGLTFTISTATGVGQIKYTSSTISGSSYNGASKFSAQAFSL